MAHNWCAVCIELLLVSATFANIWEAQLYEDLMYDYNRLPRPVQNSTDVLVVSFGTTLIRIIDIVG